MTRTQTAIENLRQGVKKMDDSLSPLARALRKFNAGRPAKQAVDTPLGAVVLAVEQRGRLNGLLAEAGATLSRTIIVIEATVPGIAVPVQDWIDVAEAAESDAVAFLEDTNRSGYTFVVTGLKFVVVSDGGETVVDYAVLRTAEGREALGNCKVFDVRKRG